MENSENKKEVVYFDCEKNVKSKFYKIAQEKNISPGSLLRAFMRKVVKDWENSKQDNSLLDNKSIKSVLEDVKTVDQDN